MISTIRRSLVLSHLIPLIIVAPLLGIVLVYLLETQVMLPSLGGELAEQAGLVAEMTNDQPGLWTDPARAQAFADRITPRLTAHLMLLDGSGRLLASSDGEGDAGQPEDPLDPAGLAQALAGVPVIQISNGRNLSHELADALAPVFNADGRVTGVVRLSRSLIGPHGHARLSRSLVAGALFIVMIVGAATSVALALDMSRLIQQITAAAEILAYEREPEPLVAKGPRELRTLAEAVNFLAARLHRLEDARRRLLANLVHELGRPLGALLAAVQALQEGAWQDDALRGELFGGMEMQISRLQRLLSKLAYLYERVEGAPELDRRPVDPAEWLSVLLPPWRVAALQKGLRWEQSIPAGLPVLSADADRLAQALGNLISNAIKYTPAPGCVSVSAGTEAGELWLRVDDTGPGIYSEEQSRVFTPFYRGRAAGRFPQGMGIGLSIAWELVTAHGGRLTIDSAPDEGSRFTIWLPVPATAKTSL